MMTCAEILEYLSAYLDNDLDEELAAEARHHLETCQNCQIMLDTTQKAILLCRQTGKTTIPMDRRSRLFNQIQSALENKERKSAEL